MKRTKEYEKEKDKKVETMVEKVQNVVKKLER